MLALMTGVAEKSAAYKKIYDIPRELKSPPKPGKSYPESY
jgi:hypothetical protein